MLVFNLTDKPLNYRGILLGADGGSHDFRDMEFIPNRDLLLERKRVLAFGTLPDWWIHARHAKNLEMHKKLKEAKESKEKYVPVLPTPPKAVETTSEDSKQSYKKK